MPYEQYKVVNLALARIGVKKITEADWGDPVTQQAIDADAVWEFIRDEVLEARQWVFAKKRAQLIRGPIPLVNWDFAYILPDDFLKPWVGQDSPQKQDLAVYPSGYPYAFESIVAGVGIITSNETIPTDGDTVTIGTKTYTFKTTLTPTEGQVLIGGSAAKALDNLRDAINHKGRPDTDYSCAAVHPEVVSTENTDTTQKIVINIEDTVGADIATSTTSSNLAWGDTTLIDEEVKCLLTDYEDSEDNGIFLIYIFREDNVAKWSASFISSFAFRLAAELAITRTESRLKYGDLMVMYGNSLINATEINQGMDWLEGEKGNSDWETAGRG